MHAHLNVNSLGLHSVEICAVNKSHCFRVNEGEKSYIAGVSIFATRDQLETISARLKTYLRSLDPPEAPLPDRDMTAPQEEFPPPIPKANYHESCAEYKDTAPPPVLPACNCGADRTGPSAEAHAAYCRAAQPGTYSLPHGGTVTIHNPSKTADNDGSIRIDNE